MSRLKPSLIDGPVIDLAAAVQFWRANARRSLRIRRICCGSRDRSSATSIVAVQIRRGRNHAGAAPCQLKVVSVQINPLPAAACIYTGGTPMGASPVPVGSVPPSPSLTATSGTASPRLAGRSGAGHCLRHQMPLLRCHRGLAGVEARRAAIAWDARAVPPLRGTTHCPAEAGSYDECYEGVLRSMGRRQAKCLIIHRLLGWRPRRDSNPRPQD